MFLVHFLTLATEYHPNISPLRTSPTVFAFRQPGMLVSRHSDITEGRIFIFRKTLDVLDENDETQRM